MPVVPRSNGKRQCAGGFLARGECKLLQVKPAVRPGCNCSGDPIGKRYRSLRDRRPGPPFARELFVESKVAGEQLEAGAGSDGIEREFSHVGSAARDDETLLLWAFCVQRAGVTK